MDAELLELCPHTVTVKRFVENDRHGQPTFGDESTHRALVEPKEELVRTVDGREVVAKTRVFVAGPITLSVQDRIVLPDGTTPPLLTVEHYADIPGGENHHAEVRL